jgi:hypothetical protein
LAGCIGKVWVQLLAVVADAALSCSRRMNLESIAVSFPGWKSSLAATGWPESQQERRVRKGLAVFC